MIIIINLLSVFQIMLWNRPFWKFKDTFSDSQNNSKKFKLFENWHFFSCFFANLIGINWNRVKIGTFLLFQQWNIHNKHPINCYKFFQWLFFKFFNCICKTAVCGPFWTISAPTWERGAAEKKGSKYIFFIPINESPIIGETKTIVK